jgi:hypothetical protein
MQPLRKPFVGILRVRIPPGRAWPRNQKRVLRPVGRPTGRGVDSECPGPAMEPRNYLSLGALVVMRSGGHVGARYGLVRPVLPGSENRAQAHEGFPRNLGRPTVSVSSTTGFWGWPDRNTPGPKPASGLVGANTDARDRNRLAKETKWDGKGGRESERSIVPAKPGNSCREDPVEGRGRLVVEPWPGNSAGALDPDSLST